MRKASAWPADKVSRWPIDKLIPYARNARMHSPEQVSQIAGSIREWGWTIPVLVDEEGTIIAGHGRILAAQQLGLSEVPVMVAEGWSDAKKKAYRIADNKLALNATWDEDMLLMELGDIREDNFDLDAIGFSAKELEGMLGMLGGEEDEDQGGTPGSLSARFGIPPFTVLNAREGWWQDRKRAWIAIGIQSELGRGETAGDKLAMSDTVQRLKPAADQATKRADAIPGGAGKNAVVRDMGKRMRANAEPGGGKDAGR